MDGGGDGTTAPAPPPPKRRSRGTLLLVLGGLAAVVALIVLLLGLGLILIHGSERDDDGYFTSDTTKVAAPGYAVTTDEIDLGTDTDWVPDKILGDVRLRATGADGGEVFVGIGPSDEVARYLGGVARSELTDLDDDGSPVLSIRPGGRPAGPPAREDVWSEQAEGSGEQEVVWDPEPGAWTAVLMNADGGRDVSANVSVGMKIGWVLWAGIALAAAGLILGALGALAIVRGSRRRAEYRAATRGG